MEGVSLSGLSPAVGAAEVGHAEILQGAADVEGQLRRVLAVILDLEDELLFPSLATGREAMLIDSRKLLDHIAARAGWKAGEMRSKALRHTYCAARLQTLDGGAPVSIYTVSRELGHTSPAMVQRVYAHLGTVRHRSAVVEYRIEQHRKALGKRLEALERAP